MMKKFFIPLLLLLLTVPIAYAGDLADVKEAGVLRFGVSPDNYPFAFYDRNDELTGIDIRLMEEIADLLDVELEIYDMAYDSLTNSLLIGQVDVAGGAFSKTNKLKNLISFSKIYYKTGPIFLSRQDLAMKEPLSAESFKGMKIGVRKGTCFEEWLKTDFLEMGTVPEKDIYAFTKIDDAIRAMNRQKIDLIMMDANVYISGYQNDPDYRTWQYGSAEDSYAFGLRKGSDLRTEINRHLTNLLADGTAQEIADRFFSEEDPGEQPLVQWQPNIPTPVPTEIPPLSIFADPVDPSTLPTAAVSTAPVKDQCSSYSMTYVTDITIPDGTQISPGNKFTKTWRIKNTGSCNWTPDFTFAFVSGNQMGGQTRHLPRIVYPGETIDISVDMIAPAAAGSYTGDWQLKTPQGYGIGTPIWLKITVPGGSFGPTPEPYFGPVQQESHPELLWYYPNFYTQKTGQCVMVYWGVTNNSTAELFVDGVSVYFGSEEQYKMQICNEIQSVGTHYIKLCAYGTGNDACETLIYTTIP